MLQILQISFFFFPLWFWNIFHKRTGLKASHTPESQIVQPESGVTCPLTPSHTDSVIRGVSKNMICSKLGLNVKFTINLRSQDERCALQPTHVSAIKKKELINIKCFFTAFFPPICNAHLIHRPIWKNWATLRSESSSGFSFWPRNRKGYWRTYQTRVRVSNKSHQTTILCWMFPRMVFTFTVFLIVTLLYDTFVFFFFLPETSERLYFPKIHFTGPQLHYTVIIRELCEQSGHYCKRSFSKSLNLIWPTRKQTCGRRLLRHVSWI